MVKEDNKSDNSILVIAINYSNETEVLEYAKMLSKQTVSENIRLVIVINKMSLDRKDTFAEEVSNISLKIKLVDPKENLGYLNGALYGYRNFTQDETYNADWVVISNTDIIIEDSRFFEKFGQTDYNDDIWCVGPSIFSPSKNSYDNPHYLDRCKLSKINRLIWIHDKPIIAFLYHKLSKIKASSKKMRKKESQYVYSNHGSFFFLNIQIVEKIKNIFYEPFLYSEEAFIAEQIISHNKKSYYDSALELIHNENSVTGLLGIKRTSQYIANSLRYIKDEFYIK